MIKILCFGDSITLGEADLEQGGWADRLKTYFFQQSASCQTQEVILYNLGVAGETTDGLVNRFEAEVRARYIKGHKLMVIIAYGANDIVIHKNKNIVPESYFVRNLKHCIESIKQLNADLLLLNILPISDSIEGVVNQHGKLRYDQDIQKYNSVIENLSAEINCDFLDLYTLFNAGNKEELLSNDGVHPNSKGHWILYQRIKQQVL